MCRIVQDVRNCIIWHTKVSGKYVRFYRMSEPIKSDTPRYHGNVSDCTGCQNLSNPTHQGNREMCNSVEDVRTCIVSDYTGSDIMYNLTHFPDTLVCRIRQVLTSCTAWYISLIPWCVGLDRVWHPVHSDTFTRHQGIREMYQAVQDVRTCLIRHTNVSGKCVRLYMMSEPV
jgi:hypothetical protein